MSPQGEIIGLPVSHRDNSGVYSAVQKISEHRQTVGCVYQYQRHSPRLHINASLTLHLYMAEFGEWPFHFFSFLPFLIHFLSTLLDILPPSFYLFFISFFDLATLLPPAFSLCSFIPRSSYFCSMPPFTSHPVYVCHAYHSRLIYYTTG